MSTNQYNSQLNKIIQADCMEVLKQLEASSVDLIYMDPPFSRKEDQTPGVGGSAYDDQFDDYMEFLKPILEEANRVLAPHGSMYLHIDSEQTPCVLELMEAVFGGEFKSGIGFPPQNDGELTGLPNRYDNVFCFVKDPQNYVSNAADLGTGPHIAKWLEGEGKGGKAKRSTLRRWKTITRIMRKEGTGYPTQKPLGLMKQIITASSNPGDLVLDFFAGSGTTGEAAMQLGRRFILVDNSPAAFEVMAKRFAKYPGINFVKLSRISDSESSRLPNL